MVHNRNEKDLTDGQEPILINPVNYIEKAIFRADRANYDGAQTWAAMAQALASERQAAALERIAASLEKIEEPIANNMGDMEAHIHLLTLAIEKIAGSKGIIGTRNVDAV